MEKENSMSAQDTSTIVRQEFDAYNHHTSDTSWLDKSLALVSEDCEVIDVPSGMKLHGRDGYKQFLLGWSTAFPDSITENVNLFATDDQVLAEFIGRGTNTGPLHAPTGDIKPTNKKMDLPFCQVFHVKSGKIDSMHIYYDSMSLMQQLGVISKPEGRASS
jgi:steroid delta-isomerase-like uncharacterized protein